MIGLIATLAPTIGPTVGGYVTDALSWHWLFFINIVPGLIVAGATWLLVDFDKPDLSLLENFDWWGLLSHGRLSRRARNTCWRRDRATTGSTTAPSPWSR